MRAFPILYVRDVEGVAAFYQRFGFEQRFRLDDPDGTAGFISMERDGAGLAVTVEESPRMFAGTEPGPGPRHEMWIYVADPEGNLVSVATDPAG